MKILSAVATNISNSSDGNLWQDFVGYHLVLPHKLFDKNYKTFLAIEKSDLDSEIQYKLTLGGNTAF